MSDTTVRLKANDPCWCGSGQKFKRCHKAATDPIRQGAIAPHLEVPDAIAKPMWAGTGVVERWNEPAVKSADVIDRMRRTARDAADVLVAVGRHVGPGVTTDELDRICHDETVRRGGYPSPLDYAGPVMPFPKSICTSINEVICHGIPDDRPLRDGDIVNLDVTVFKDGVHGDTNATFLVGRVDPESRRLVRVTKECLERGIEAVRPGLPLNVIGKAIQQHAEDNGFGVVREFVGHGIGEQFHTTMHIPHYFDPAMTLVMEPGMTFTIEPMITAGSPRLRVWDDGWTAVTIDGSRSAQFEHTLLVTDDGAEILTVPSSSDGHPYWA
jgi:methionyl aminopeptidase